MNIRTSLLGAAFLASGASIQAQAQAVLLRVAPPVGQVTHYRTVSQTWMQIPGMTPGDTTQPAMTQTMFTTRTVTAMDGTARVVTTVVDSSQRQMPGMGGAGMGGDMLRGMITTQHVDPRGRVLSSEVTPPPGAPPMVAQALQRSGSRGTPAMPERAVTPGETWSDTMSMPLGGGRGSQAATTFVMTYKLERVERGGGGRVAVVSMAGAVHTDSAAAAGATTGTMTGEIAFDLDASRMLHMLMDMSARVQTQQGVLPVHSKTAMEAQP